MSVSKPTSRRELIELNTQLRKMTDSKKVRAQLRRKITKEGFTDLQEAWDSVHAPPPSAPEGAEPEPEAEESPQVDP